MSELKTTKKIYPGYKEWYRLTDAGVKFMEFSLFGKWQYIYKYKNLEFSLISFHRSLYGSSRWELFNRDSFEVYGRFKTKVQAEKFILDNF